MKTFISNSPEDTKRLGRILGKVLKKGDIIGLVGQLGSGKTTFTKGIADGLGVKNPEYVNSPSFVIIKEYKGKKYKPSLYHIDLYRLGELKNIYMLGCQEYLYGNGISVIEWAEKFKNLLPKEYLKINIYIKGKTKRIFKFFPKGTGYKNLLKKLTI